MLSDLQSAERHLRRIAVDIIYVREVARFDALWTNGNNIAGFNADRRNINTATIELKMPVAHELTRLATARCETSAI